MITPINFGFLPFKVAVSIAFCSDSEKHSTAFSVTVGRLILSPTYTSVRPIVNAVFNEFCNTVIIAFTVFGDNGVPVFMLPFSEISVMNFCKMNGESSLISKFPKCLLICIDKPQYLS